MGNVTQTDLKVSGYLFKDDDFTNTLVRLINEQYATETKVRKVALLIDMFKNPYNNTVCREKYDISSFFYQHYQSRSQK
jgi:hypothetical protein